MLKRRIAGKKAQKNGDAWEGTFYNCAIKQKTTIIRIPNGCITRGGMIIRVKSPFDWIVSIENKAAFIDTKFTKSTNYSKSMVTDHQISEMIKLENDNHIAGYLVLFQKSNQVVFYKASQLKNLQARESLSPDMGILLGSEANFNLKLIFT